MEEFFEIEVGKAVIKMKEEGKEPLTLVKKLVNLVSQYVEIFFSIKELEEEKKKLHQKIEEFFEILSRIREIRFPEKNIRVLFTVREIVRWNFNLLSMLFPECFGERIKTAIKIETPPLSLTLEQLQRLEKEIENAFSRLGLSKPQIRIEAKVEEKLPEKNIPLPQELQVVERILEIRPRRG